ncbi:MAG: ribose 5-phosphate isomerase B [Candidatus Humimicrobiaceae bacterium]
MKILIGSDHAAFKYKEEIIRFLKEDGYIIEDMGIYEEAAIKDYSIAERVGLDVSRDKSNRGILICGTGIGMSISVNKIPGVRAALCHNLFTAEMSRLHNNSNILIFGSRVIDIELAKEMVKIWLNTEFEGGRHIQRNEHIMALDKKYRCNPSEDS